MRYGRWVNVPSFETLRLVPGYSLVRSRFAEASERPADPAREHGFSTTQLWGALGLSMAVCAGLMWMAGLSIDPLQPGNAAYFLALLLLLGIRVVFADKAFRWAGAGADCAEYFVLFTALALTGAVSSYPIAAMSHGFADAELQWIDAVLRFDWLAWYDVVSRHRSLQLLGVLAYQSIYLTPALLLGTFALNGQRRDAHLFLASFWLAAIITLTLYRFMPAVGPLSYLWKGDIPYMPTSEVWQIELIPALRTHQESLINLSQLRGLVSAPSFHAASGVLYIAAAWRAGLMRWPLIALSLCMLLSTPIEGTHYLSDMILGAMVALVGLGGASVLIQRFGTARAAR